MFVAFGCSRVPSKTPEVELDATAMIDETSPVPEDSDNPTEASADASIDTPEVAPPDTAEDLTPVDTVEDVDASAQETQDAPADTSSEVALPSNDPFERGVIGAKLRIEPIARGLLATEPTRSVAATFAFDGLPEVSVRVTLPPSDHQRDFTAKPTFALRFDATDAPLAAPYDQLEGVRLGSMVDDPSHLRERLAHHIADRAGLPVPRSTYARLVLSGGDEPDLDLGLYSLTETHLSPAYLERALPTGVLPSSIFESRDRSDLWPWQIADHALVSGHETDRSALSALAERLETFRKARLDGQPLTLSDALDGSIDLQSFTAAMALDIAIGHWSGYGRYLSRYALHAAAHGHITFLSVSLGESLDPSDIPNPWQGGGKLLWHCRDDAACRLMLGQALAQLAVTLSDPALLAEASALRFLARSELDTDTLREADNALVDASQEALLEALSERGPWLSDNLACAVPSAVDRDGDGVSACTNDCDDDRAEVHPGATEQCNLRDDDCNGILDDAPECEPCVLEDGPRPGTTWAICHRPETWESARQDCQERGGELVSLASAEEQTAFLRLALGLHWTSWWIGLSDLESEGTFAWADGEPVLYTHWNEGEPNDYGGREDCAELMPWGRGLWNDLPCDRERPYVCLLP